MKACVAGILVRDRKFLVEKRYSDDADPGYVAIPGGHVEAGESLEDALKREMKEELGIQVLKTRFVRVGYHKTTDGERRKIHYFHVEQWNDSPRANEAKNVYWEARIDNLWAVADRRAVKEVL